LPRFPVDTPLGSTDYMGCCVELSGIFERVNLTSSGVDIGAGLSTPTCHNATDASCAIPIRTFRLTVEG